MSVVKSTTAKAKKETGGIWTMDDQASEHKIKEPIEKPLDPKTIEILIKLAEVGKITFVLETKKDVSKLVKKAVDAGIKYISKKLEELDQ